jgi:hypothetical protein
LKYLEAFKRMPDLHHVGDRNAMPFLLSGGHASPRDIGELRKLKAPDAWSRRERDGERLVNPDSPMARLMGVLWGLLAAQGVLGDYR